MNAYRSAAGLALLALALAGVVAGTARADDGARGLYDFEQDVQGFMPIQVKDGTPAPDESAKLTVTHDKNIVKSGSGSLAYNYSIEPKSVRALVLDTRVPANSRSVRFWLKSSVPTAVLLSLRKESGATYELPTQLPAFEWVQVGANIDELQLSKEHTDPDGKLAPDQVRSIMLADVANFLINAPGEIGKAVQAGPRQLWMDDLQFSSEALPQSCGVVKSDGRNAYLVDNFETGILRWAPVHVDFSTGAPVFHLFPPEVIAKVLPEAGAPGAGKGPLDPGGKGLRFSYKRGDKEAFAFIRSLERVDLSHADRLHISLNASAKSMLVVQVKEKGGAEYQSTIMPDDSTGWHNLDLPLSDFSLSPNSKDDDGKLDPDQITELAIIDGSSFLGGAVPGGDITLDVDSVWFSLKP